MSEFGFELNRVAPELAILTATLFHFLLLDFYITLTKRHRKREIENAIELKGYIFKGH